MASNLLLNSNEDLIRITIYYRVQKNKYGSRQFQILPEEKALELLKKEDSDVETLETYWSPQTWQVNNSISKQSMSYNKVHGNEEIDWSLYQQNIFKHCLKKWNVTDDDGNEIPPTPENVGMLPTMVARALLQEYNNSLSVDEEEKKE